MAAGHDLLQAGGSFIGAGAIIMTKWRRVRGLTTAAGLWVVAIVGLCCGAGFYEGAAYATFLVRSPGPPCGSC